MKSEVTIIILMMFLTNIFGIFVFSNNFSFHDVKLESTTSILDGSIVTNITTNINSPSVKIPIVSVNPATNKGSVGFLSVKKILGKGNVLIEVNPYLEPDLQQSIFIATNVAKQISKSSNKLIEDLVFEYSVNAQLIGGGSAGAATAVAAYALLENKTIRSDTAITGTIKPDGSIGKIAGLFAKTKAVAELGYNRFIIPYGQGTLVTYNPKYIEYKDVFGQKKVRKTYETQTFDLVKYAKENYNLEIIEVNNIKDVLNNIIL